MIENKHFLITGGAGFIGTRLISEVIENNRVTVLDTLHRNALAESGLADHPNLTLIKADVRDPVAVRQAMKGGVTHIVHLASIAGVDTVINNPQLTMDVCVKGTFNILEAALENDSLERFVDFSTSEVFGSYAFRVSEGDVTSLGVVGEARWTYAVSKLATEHLCHVMHKQHGMPVVTIRPFNIFGPGQVGSGAIHHFAVKAIKNEPITIHNDGDQIRAWCFVDDMIDGLMLALEKPEAVGNTFNIGNPRTAVTVYHLAKLVVQAANSSSELVHKPWPYPDVELRIPDITRARDLLGFAPKVDIEEGLEQTIQWYRTIT